MASIDADALRAATARTLARRNNTDLQFQHWAETVLPTLPGEALCFAKKGETIAEFPTPFCFSNREWQGRPLMDILKEMFPGCWIRFAKRASNYEDCIGHLILVGWVSGEETDRVIEHSGFGGLGIDNDW